MRTLDALIARSVELRDLSLRGGNDGLLTIRYANLTEAEREQLAELERAATAMLAALKQAFDLPSHYDDARHALYSQFAALWVNLEDIRPERLRRYGAVNPAAAQKLSPYVEQFIELSLAFQRVLKKES